MTINKRAEKQEIVDMLNTMINSASLKIFHFGIIKNVIENCTYKKINKRLMDKIEEASPTYTLIFETGFEINEKPAFKCWINDSFGLHRLIYRQLRGVEREDIYFNGEMKENTVNQDYHNVEKLSLLSAVSAKIEGLENAVKHYRESMESLDDLLARYDRMEWAIRAFTEEQGDTFIPYQIKGLLPLLLND